MDVYKIGVNIAMSTNANQILGLLSRELTGLEKYAKSLEQGLGNVRAAAIGAVMAFAGFEGLKGIWHIVEASKELNKELVRNKELGGEFADTQKALNASVAMQRAVPTSRTSQNVAGYREFAQQFGSTDEARDMMSFVGKATYAASFYTGENYETVQKNLIKIAESRGAIYDVDAQGNKHFNPEK